MSYLKEKVREGPTYDDTENNRMKRSDVLIDGATWTNLKTLS